MLSTLNFRAEKRSERKQNENLSKVLENTVELIKDKGGIVDDTNPIVLLNQTWSDHLKVETVDYQREEACAIWRNYREPWRSLGMCRKMHNSEQRAAFAVYQWNKNRVGIMAHHLDKDNDLTDEDYGAGSGDGFGRKFSSLGAVPPAIPRLQVPNKDEFRLADGRLDQTAYEAEKARMATQYKEDCDLIKELNAIINKYNDTLTQLNRPIMSYEGFTSHITRMPRDYLNAEKLEYQDFLQQDHIFSVANGVCEYTENQGAVPEKLIYQGTPDYKQLAMQCTVKDDFLNVLKIPASLQNMCELGEEMGFTKRKHMMLLFKEFLAANFKASFSLYNTIKDPDVLAEAIIQRHRTGQEIIQTKERFKKLCRNPGDPIQAIAQAIISIKTVELREKEKREKRREIESPQDFKRIGKSASDFAARMIPKFCHKKVREVVEENAKMREFTSEKYDLEDVISEIELIELHIPSLRVKEPIKLIDDTYLIQACFAETKKTPAIRQLENAQRQSRFTEKKEERKRSEFKRGQGSERERGRGRDFKRDKNTRGKDRWGRRTSSSPRNRSGTDSSPRRTDSSPARSSSQESNTRSRTLRNQGLPAELNPKVIKKMEEKGALCARCESRMHITRLCPVYSRTSLKNCRENRDGFHHPPCRREDVKRADKRNPEKIPYRMERGQIKKPDQRDQRRSDRKDGRRDPRDRRTSGDRTPRTRSTSPATSAGGSSSRGTTPTRPGMN